MRLTQGWRVVGAVAAHADGVAVLLERLDEVILVLRQNPGKDREILGAYTIGDRSGWADFAIQAYGMSEGAPISSDKRVDPRLLSADYPGVGKVLPGARLRICELGSQTTLNRNVPGELHIGGTSVISGYLNDANPESFYTDEYGSWLRTGDQALIDDNGVLQILGRYKDLIIRGGENISPANIESHMGQIPGLLVSIHYQRNSCLWPIKCYFGSERNIKLLELNEVDI